MKNLYDDNKNNICRICGRSVNAGVRICERCEESLSLCDIDEYVSGKTSAYPLKKGCETLLKQTGLCYNEMD